MAWIYLLQYGESILILDLFYLYVSFQQKKNPVKIKSPVVFAAFDWKSDVVKSNNSKYYKLKSIKLCFACFEMGEKNAPLGKQWFAFECIFKKTFVKWIWGILPHKKWMKAIEILLHFDLHGVKQANNFKSILFISVFYTHISHLMQAIAQKL